MHMIYNLILEIPYLSVEPFESAMGFHYQVWYGRANFVVESLNIGNSVIYPYSLECIDTPSDLVLVDTTVKCLQTHHFISERFSISQVIDNLTQFFLFDLVGKFGLVPY